VDGMQWWADINLREVARIWRVEDDFPAA
jgi:hypothetical protein